MLLAMLSESLLTLHGQLLAGALMLVGSLWLDKWLGEPARFHPLVGFGHWANAVQTGCRALSLLTIKQQGVLAWSIAVLPLVLACYLLLNALLSVSPWLWACANIIIVYLTIGGNSLLRHADNIYQPLQLGNLAQARDHVAMIVSRNTENMGEKEIVSSAIESVLENGNDAVFAPMIWFLLLGAPGAVLLRLCNTLDAMWGYKNEKYLHFGWFSAKSDDFLGWLPARITALFYALQGNFRQSLYCWRHQAKTCKSPNGGVVMTAGAGALGIVIGGPTYYDGVLYDKKPMGIGSLAQCEAIPRANRLVSRGSFGLSYLWLISVLIVMICQ